MIQRIDWERISPPLFQEIVAALLRAMGYHNVVVRGASQDEGWDIDAQLSTELPDGERRLTTWRVECKRYKKNVSPVLVRDHFHRMIDTLPVPDHVLLVTTSGISNPLRTDLESFARARNVGHSIWESRKVRDLIEAHLGDARLWELIGPHVEIGLPMALLESACRHQVAVEIQQRVGRKFLPELFQRRPLEEDIGRFLDCDVAKTQVEALHEGLKRIQSPQKTGTVWEEALSAIGSCRSWIEAKPHLDRLLEADDDRLRIKVAQAVNGARLRRNTFLVRDRAGSGKTNLLCHLATGRRAGTLFLFFSCKLDLPPSRSLAELILGAVGNALAHEHGEALFRTPQELARALELTLRREGAQLVILLDGINENRDLAALDDAIVDLLLQWNDFPVKFLLTCRDIFWSYFREERWAPFLYDGKIHELPAFAEHEIDDVQRAYFAAFDIRGQLTGAAREKSRHPLLLRFFCEAYRGRDVREFQDLRLKDLFEEYWRRKQEEIADSLGLGVNGGRRVEIFLARLVDHMMERGATQVIVGDLSAITGEGDLDSNRSLYRRLLDQDIILEEMPPPAAFDRSYLARRISFVYDEFFDYMMAIAHARNHQWEEKDAREICLDFLALFRQSDSFEQLRGVCEYLVLMAEESGLHKVICALLARLGSPEVLCNVLPKLRDDGPWIEEVMRRLLLSAPRHGALRPKRATGWQPPEEQVEHLLLKLEDADVSRIYSILATAHG